MLYNGGMRTGVGVEVDHLSVDYPAARPLFGPRSSTTQTRRHRALHDVTFSVEAGERIGVIGMNGAGKSTLFRTIAGILTPASGRVDVGGHISTSTNRLPAGYMASYPLLYRRLTGYENLRYVANLYDVRDVNERVHFLAERVGLADRLYDYVEQYSRGMMARLDLARVLLPSPPILLLDEPFSSFDVQFVDEVQQIIRESRATVLFATHQLGDIEKLTHRIILLHQGRLLRDVSFEDLSEVAPQEGGKLLTTTEFVELLLRRSVGSSARPQSSIHRKYVISA